MASTPTSSPWQLATRTARMNPSAIREILKLTELPGIISLAGGLPSALTFPVEAVRVASCQGDEVGVDAIGVPIDAGSERVAGDPV